MEDVLLGIDAYLEQQRRQARRRNWITWIVLANIALLYACFIYSLHNEYGLYSHNTLVWKIRELFMIGLLFVEAGLIFDFNHAVFDSVFWIGLCLIALSLVVHVDRVI